MSPNFYYIKKNNSSSEREGFCQRIFSLFILILLWTWFFYVMLKKKKEPLFAKKKSSTNNNNNVVVVTKRNSIKMPPIQLEKLHLNDDETSELVEILLSDDSSSSSSSSSSTRSSDLASPLGQFMSPTEAGKPGKKSPLRGQKKLPLVLTVSISMPVASISNTKEAVAKIKSRLKRGPSDKDGHGYIYMYRHTKDYDVRYRKIGRTERLSARRLEEWPDSVLIKSWRCRRNRFAEVLIHWLLDRVRVYRYVVGKDPKTGLEIFLTVNKVTKKHVQDLAYSYLSKHGDLSVAGKHKHIEWFLTEETNLFKVINAVVTDINMHWKEEDWSEEMDQMK